ncbi:hypothetical protein [Spirosoma horti]
MTRQDGKRLIGGGLKFGEVADRTDISAVSSDLFPLSYNIILHPAHPHFNQIRVLSQEIQPVDRRLWR